MQGPDQDTGTSLAQHACQAFLRNLNDERSIQTLQRDERATPWTDHVEGQCSLPAIDARLH
jgi:hypothetical protein